MKDTNYLPDLWIRFNSEKSTIHVLEQYGYPE